MKKYNIFLFAMLLIFIAACSKSWLDVNTDPNNPSSATPDLMLPSATVSIGTVIGGNYNLLGGFWSQYWTQSPGSNQYKNIDGYHLLNTDFQAQWTDLYDYALKNLQYIREQSYANNNNSYAFMATVLECYAYQDLADLYDQIPFNEALQGASNIAPKYDPSITVYDSIAARLEKLSSLDLTVSPLSADQKGKDFIFAGDMTQWQAFANTLLLKIFMRQMYIRPDTAQAGIARLYARGANFLTTDAKLDIFIDQPGKDNPLYESDRRSLNTAANIRASSTLFKYLEANNDPRLWAIDGPGTDGKMNPLPVSNPQGGYSIVYTVAQLASISVAVINATDPVYFMSKSESDFLQAEAIAMGWGTGDDNALYNAGVTASFEKFLPSSNPDSIANALLTTDTAYTYPASGSFSKKQRAIIMQKWIALAGSEGLEAFLETNRTHVPSIAPASVKYTIGGDNTNYNNWEGGQLLYSLDGATGGLFPKRLLFPNIERQENPNTPAEVPITTKVWWDVKTN